MSNPIGLNRLIFPIPSEKYQEFCSQLKNNIVEDFSLHLFKDRRACELITQLCADFYSEEIKLLRLNLNDIKLGIAAIDVPEISDFETKENAIFGAAVVIGIFNNIGISNLDPMNQMPFVVHTASHDNEQQLDSRRLDKFTPEMKLGFHNDGLLSSKNIEIPHHILVYNLFIGYHRPGNFIWIPTTLWEEVAKFKQLAKIENITVKIKLSPNYHLNKNGNIVNTMLEYIDVPISSTSAYGQAQFFLNGQVLLENNSQKHVDFVQAMRESLASNSIKIHLPQKERRAFYIRNTAGFHARNIFEDPIDNINLTRVYLRAVDANSEFYSALN